MNQEKLKVKSTSICNVDETIPQKSIFKYF